jgi:hypothetical protein
VLNPIGGVVAGLTALPRPVESGYIAATIGGLVGAAACAWIGWELVPLLGVEGDRDLGPANLAFGLAVLLLMVGGGMIIGGLVGIGLGLRVAGHRGIAATVGVAAALTAVLGALLIYLAVPLAVAAPLLAVVPAAARWLVTAIVRRRELTPPPP